MTIYIISCLVLFYELVATSSVFAQERLVAELNGTEVSPPVNTTANGYAEFVLSAGPFSPDSYITYNVSASGIQNVTEVHLHNGPRMLNGTLSNNLIVLPDYETSGIISNGNISNSDTFLFELGGKGSFALQVLADYLFDGEIYVDIHTEKHPEGEIRGQIYGN